MQRADYIDDGEDLAERQSIPGTVVFDMRQSRIGYELNMFCMTLQNEANRAAFKADEAGYVSSYPLSDEQKRALSARDYNRLIELGGNIYYLSKIAAVDGHSFQKIAAMMSGVSEDEFRSMMSAGGRQPTERSPKPTGAE
jgi:protocatechuate 4,5-dioxygenase alpha chain